MSDRRFPSRRARTTGAAVVLVLVLVAGGAWYATRGTTPPPPPAAPAGPPIVKEGVTYEPVKVPGSPEGKVDGYAPRFSAATSEALKSGKTVVLPAPNGGKIEVRPVEKTPTPPAEKK